MTSSSRARSADLTGRLARTLVDRARWLAAALALITALAGWQALNLRVEVDLSGLIGPGTAGAQGVRAYAERFAPLRAEEVLLVTGRFGQPGGLAALEDLLLDLQFVPGIEQVISLFALPGPPPAPETLAALREANPLAAQLLSADLSATIVVAVPQPGAGGAGFARALVQAAAGSGLEVTPIGLSAVQRAVAGELIRDLGTLTPAAVAICLLLSLALFRGFRAVLACALPPVAGLLWFAGWLGAADIPIDPMMGALPVVLIVLAFSDSLHIYHAAIHETGPDRKAAIARAVAQTLPAVVLTSATTMIAFASLALPESPSLNRLALTGCMGMAVTLAAVVLWMPVLMALLGVPPPGARVPAAFQAVVPPALRAARGGWRVALAAAVALGLLWAAQSQSRPGFRYADYLPQAAEVTRALARAEALGLGADRLLVVVEEDAGRTGAHARAAAGAVWGPAGAAWIATPEGAGMLARMAARDGSAHALPVQAPISAAGAPADAGLRRIEAQLAEAGLSGVARVTGPGQALASEGPRLVANLRLGLYLTIGAITALVAVVYGSLRIAAVALVANLIPLLGVEAWLVLAGRELTIMNMVALTVAFGIAVDDTLHFLNRFRLARGLPTAEAVDAAIATAGPPIAATTMVLLAGLLVTLASALPGLAVFGLLIGIAVVLALAADLFLLPGLLRWSLR